mmetsp:Transcript_29495/g.76100  ORF Transcript_29495/g.76100 Transcript_29495/m.76100 type:complete len:212 (+) Transcript_29495:2274-2909(+)
MLVVRAEQLHEGSIAHVRLARGRAHEGHHLRHADSAEAEPVQRAVHFGQREQPVVVAVKHEEGVMEQQAACRDGLAHVRAQRFELQHRPLVVESEDLSERRLLPALGKATAASDGRGKEEATRGRRAWQRAQQHVELIRAVVHAAVEEAEGLLRHASLVGRRGGKVGCGVEDGVVRGDAAQRHRHVGARHEVPSVAHVQDAADRLGLGERE